MFNGVPYANDADIDGNTNLLHRGEARISDVSNNRSDVLRTQEPKHSVSILRDMLYETCVIRVSLSVISTLKLIITYRT